VDNLKCSISLGKLLKCKLVSTCHFLKKPHHSTITPRGRKVTKILLILKSKNFLMIHLKKPTSKNALDFIVLLLSELDFAINILLALGLCCCSHVAVGP